MKYFKVITTILLVLLVLHVLVFINFTIRYGRNNGLSGEHILSYTLYFFCFSALLLLTLRLKSKKRLIFLVFLITTFPTIRFGGDSGLFVNVCGFSRSFAELLIGSSVLNWPSGSSERYLKLIDGIKNHNILVVYQSYSILFAIVISFILLKARNVYNSALGLYSNNKYFMFICVLIFAIYVLFDGESRMISYMGDSVRWYKALLYTFLYTIILIVYVIIRKHYKIRNNEIIVIIFILLFPIISVSSNTYNAIITDTVPRYDRTLTLAPLVSALPMTIKYLISDLYFQMKYYTFSIKLYTLFQVFMVLFLFPSLLTPKINQNG